MNRKHVLHVVSAMNRGGAETLLMNVYRNLDPLEVQFDFVSHREETGDYDEEITSMGGKVYRISSLGQTGPVAYMRQLKKIMKENPYVAVHAHTDYQSGLVALAAKSVGIRKRICHAHSNKWPRNTSLKKRVGFKAFQALIHYAGTDYGACSLEAASFLFGEKKLGSHKMHILKNGIDIEEYFGGSPNRINVKDEYGIPPEAKIIGHVGNFSDTKNQAFLLKVLIDLLEKGENVVVMFVGDGEMRNAIEEEAHRLGVLNQVRFLGVRNDIPKLMKAFDVFIFPSLYEGFGIVTIEAQCAGTPCVVSDTVPKSTDMGLGLMSYIGLDEELSVWTEEIKRAFTVKSPDPRTIAEQFSQKGFNIRENVSNWLALYGIPETTNAIFQ